MWRCPHCGTPQAETARCWVCRRSSTACATCRHFRRSVAAQLGYCGLDRERRPLRGDEIRACWEARSSPIVPDDAPAGGDPAHRSAPSPTSSRIEHPFGGSSSSRSARRRSGRASAVAARTAPRAAASRTDRDSELAELAGRLVDRRRRAALEPVGRRRGLSPGLVPRPTGASFLPDTLPETGSHVIRRGLVVGRRCDARSRSRRRKIHVRARIVPGYGLRVSPRTICHKPGKVPARYPAGRLVCQGSRRRPAATPPMTGPAPTYRPGGPRPERDLERHVLAVAQDIHGDRVARRELGERRVERMLLVDDLAVDADDDVAVLDPGVRRRACRPRRPVTGSPFASKPPTSAPTLTGSLLLSAICRVIDTKLDAHVRPAQRLAGDGLGHDRPGDVDRDGEADAVAVLRRSRC